ncbi:MAG: glycosyltransferase [Sphingomonas sp.]|nr:glycosyltransferase [Sphingomonas sp.]
MAAYNGAALTGETLDSLWAQSFADFEIVVVDDCSTDDTREVLAAVRDPRLRVIHADENGGPVRSRNRAVTEARGRYLAGLDQDDICLPHRFARQVAYLDAHPDIALVGASANILEDGAVSAHAKAAVTTPRLIEWLLLIENPLVWSTAMIRRAALPAGEFTRPDYRYAEDFDLYHRLARHGGIARIDEPLLLYRRHGGGASQRYTETMQANATRVLAERYTDEGVALPDAKARLIVRHLMEGEAVPDAATLAEIGALLTGLQAHFLATRPIDDENLRLIRWETALRWGKMVRTALKAGTVSIGQAAGIRPDHLGLGYTRLDELLMAGLRGSAKAKRGRAA